MSSPFLRVLLGPQRFQPTLGAVIASLDVKGPIATVTAGWQERESDDHELHEHLGKRTVNLELYRRTRRAFTRDPELRMLYRGRSDALRRLHELYRVRLGYAMSALASLQSRQDDSQELEQARSDALDAVRRLDVEHLERTAQIHLHHESRITTEQRAVIEEERREIMVKLEDVELLAIAGGHVAVLLNRLRLFRIAEIAARMPLIAWSAGAMAVSDRVVLFHDSPPQGAGNAEVLENGLGLVTGLVPLPHARRRLRLDDPARVALLAQRLAPAVCVAMEDGSRLDCTPEFQAHTGITRLSGSGAIVPGMAS